MCLRFDVLMLQGHLASFQVAVKDPDTSEAGLARLRTSVGESVAKATGQQPTATRLTVQ